MKCRRCLQTFIFFTTFFHVSAAVAATVTWDGGGSGNNWSTAANWSGDAVPGAGDIVVFDGTGKTDAVVDSSFGGTIHQLQITSAFTGSITVQKNLPLIAMFYFLGVP